MNGTIVYKKGNTQLLGGFGNNVETSFENNLENVAVVNYAQMLHFPHCCQMSAATEASKRHIE